MYQYICSMGHGIAHGYYSHSHGIQYVRVSASLEHLATSLLLKLSIRLTQKAVFSNILYLVCRRNSEKSSRIGIVSIGICYDRKPNLFGFLFCGTHFAEHLGYNYYNTHPVPTKYRIQTEISCSKRVSKQQPPSSCTYYNLQYIVLSFFV